MEFDVPAETLGTASHAYLEIEDVRDVARVFVNAEEAGTMWRPPYRLELKRLLKPGPNHVEIDVANTWVNRCLYDATLPESERITWANSMDTHFPNPDTVKPSDYFPWKSGPLPSGLIGGMRIVFSVIAVEPEHE